MIGTICQRRLEFLTPPRSESRNILPSVKLRPPLLVSSLLFFCVSSATKSTTRFSDSVLSLVYKPVSRDPWRWSVTRASINSPIRLSVCVSCSESRPETSSLRSTSSSRQRRGKFQSARDCSHLSCLARIRMAYVKLYFSTPRSAGSITTERFILCVLVAPLSPSNC